MRPSSIARSSRAWCVLRRSRHSRLGVGTGPEYAPARRRRGRRSRERGVAASPCSAPPPQPPPCLVHDQRAGVGERGHERKLEQRPLPAVRLAADDGDGGHALEGEDKVDEEAHGHEGGPDLPPGTRIDVAADLLAQGLLGLLLVIRADAVDGGQSAHEDFAGGGSADQADTDLPVEAERPYYRLQQM